jgi:hypothetical protein
MSAAAPDPAPQPSRSFGLLVLVRALIDYGRELAGALREHGTAALGLSIRHFGTDDVALILARIAHGLHLAAALEARITATAPRLDADPKPHRAPSQSKPRAPRTLAPRDDAAAPLAALVPGLDPWICLPTPEQIAAEVRRRPIGAVIADICRDLGITPSHRLWRTLQSAITRYGGNYTRLITDMMDRVFPLPVPAALLPSPKRLATQAGADPP